MLTTKADYQNSFRGIDVSFLLCISLPSLVNDSLLKLTSLLPSAKKEKSSKDGE